MSFACSGALNTKRSKHMSIKYCSTETYLTNTYGKTNDANTKRLKHIPNPSVFLIILTFVCILSTKDAHILKKLFLKIKPEG